MATALDSLMNDTIYVLVEYQDGQEEGDVGYPYYVASCVEIPAVTDAGTLDELVTNIRDIIAFALEDEDIVAEYQIAANPRIMISFELPDYAKTA